MIFKLVSEEFVTGFSNRLNSEYVEVFSNPSKQRINKLSEEFNGKRYIRYIADGKKKKLYVFPPSALHFDVAKEIRAAGYIDNPPKFLFLMGIGERVSGEWVSHETNSFSTSDEHDEDLAKGILAANWDWTKKYHLDLDPLLEKTRSGDSAYNDDLEPSFIAKKA